MYVEINMGGLVSWVEWIHQEKVTKAGGTGYPFIGNIVVLLVFTMATPVLGDGFRNPFQDSAAIAQGNAFRAQADNPSAIHYNPAGMTQLEGIQHAFGVQFINVNSEFQSPNGTKVDNDLGGTVGLPPPGQFFITGNLKELDIPIFRSMVLGLGVESLYGFANKYPQDGPFATAITRAQLPLLDIKPTLAYRVHERVSVGLGADIFTFASFLGEGHSEQQFIAVGNISGTSPGQELELNGKGTTAGLNASILIAPLLHDSGKPFLNLGFVWRSQAVLPLKGELLADGRKVADVKTSLRFPESFEWGLAVWPIHSFRYEWKVEVDVDYVRWSSLRGQNIELSNGTVLSNPQKWDDAVTIGVGTEFKWLSPKHHPNWEYAFRLGYNRSHTPIPGETFTPAFPDADLNAYTAGLGFSCKGAGTFIWILQCGDSGDGSVWRKGISLDLAYLGIFFEPRTVSGHPNPGVNGTYETTTHSGSVTFGVKF